MTASRERWRRWRASGQHLAGIPGRKSLVWIGAGVSMVSVTGAMGMGPHGSISSFEDQVKRTSQKLAQQGIVLYIVDAKGLEVPLSMTASVQGAMPVRGRGRFEPQQDSESSQHRHQVFRMCGCFKEPLAYIVMVYFFIRFFATNSKVGSWS